MQRKGNSSRGDNDPHQEPGKVVRGVRWPVWYLTLADPNIERRG